MEKRMHQGWTGLCLFTIFLLLAPLTVQAVNPIFVEQACLESYAKAAGPIPDREISQAFLKKHSRRMTREVPEQTSVADQRCLGVCHLYALYSDLGQELPESPGRDSMISLLPWIYEHWKKRAIEVATDFTLNTEVPEGAFSYLESFDAIKRAGSMPLSVWKAAGGKVDIAGPMQTLVESRLLENTITDLKTERGYFLTLLEDRTAEVSSDSALRMRKQGKMSPNSLIGAKSIPVDELRRLLAEKRRLLKAGRTHLTEKQLDLLETAAHQVNVGRKVSKEDVDGVRAALQRDIQEEMTRLFNRIFFDDPEKGPPKIFQWKGKEYTPHSFAEEFLPAIHQKVVTMVRGKDKRGKARVLGSTPLGNMTVEVPRDGLAAGIKRAIDQGDNIWLAYDHDPYFVDKKTGIMSIKAFRGSNGVYQPRWKRRFFGKTYGMHAVQVVGYDADASGKIVKWKIKNSWGPKVGDHGYFYMYDDYFNAYAEMISFRDETAKAEPAAPGIADP